MLRKVARERIPSSIKSPTHYHGKFRPNESMHGGVMFATTAAQLRKMMRRRAWKIVEKVITASDNDLVIKAFVRSAYIYLAPTRLIVKAAGSAKSKKVEARVFEVLLKRKKWSEALQHIKDAREYNDGVVQMVTRYSRNKSMPVDLIVKAIGHTANKKVQARAFRALLRRVPAQKARQLVDQQ